MKIIKIITNFKHLCVHSTEAAIDKLFVYKQGSSHIVMYDVRCSGAETILVQCSHNYFLFHDCNDVEDVVVICDKSKFEEFTKNSLVSSQSHCTYTEQRARDIDINIFSLLQERGCIEGSRTY